MDRYCGSCKRAYHHEDGSLRCEWLHRPEEKCPGEDDLSYETRLWKMDICPNCKEKLDYPDFYLGYCRKCKNKIKFKPLEL